MQELEKILEEIDQEKKNAALSIRHTTGYKAGQIRMAERIEEIIRKRMNDGWIPVEREAPPTGKRLQAKIKHHEWIADYDNDWVPEEERTRHPEYTEICEIVCVDGVWRYMCKEDGYELSEAYINPQKDISVPIDEIIAWRPLSESYRPEAAVAQRSEWQDRIMHTFLGRAHI